MQLQTNSLSERNKGYQGYRKYNQVGERQRDTRKRRRRRAAFENREAGRLFSDSLPCQLRVCRRMRFPRGFKEGHILGCVSLSRSAFLSLFLYLSFSMQFCLLCYLTVCAHNRMCVSVNVLLYLRRSEIEKERFGGKHSYKCFKWVAFFSVCECVF